VSASSARVGRGARDGSEPKATLPVGSRPGRKLGGRCWMCLGPLERDRGRCPLVLDARKPPLRARQWNRHPVVLMTPGREWAETGTAETGTLVLGVSRDQIVSKARHLGPEAVLLWDERGVSVVARGCAMTWSTARPPQWRRPRPCSVAPCGSAAHTVCRAGPTGAGRWRWPPCGGHRALLASALGCTVCEGGVVCDNGRPLALSSTFVPPRRDGWRCGPPRSNAVTPHGG
jgi:hypothetical protein